MDSKKYYAAALFALVMFQSCTQNKETLLFSSSRNGNSDIFVMEAYGDNQKALTQTGFEEWGPTWINEMPMGYRPPERG